MAPTTPQQYASNIFCRISAYGTRAIQLYNQVSPSPDGLGALGLYGEAVQALSCPPPPPAQIPGNPGGNAALEVNLGGCRNVSFYMQAFQINQDGSDAGTPPWQNWNTNNVWGWRIEQVDGATVVRLLGANGQPFWSLTWVPATSGPWRRGGLWVTDNGTGGCPGGSDGQPYTPPAAPPQEPVQVGDQYYSPPSTYNFVTNNNISLNLIVAPILLVVPNPFPVVIPTPWGDYRVRPDGGIEPGGGNAYYQRELCRCQCPPAPEIDLISLPVGICGDDGGEVQERQVSVVRGSVPAGTIALLAEGAAARKAACDEEPETPNEEPSTLLQMNATDTVQAFYYNVLPEVKAVRVHITQSSPLAVLRGQAYPTADQSSHGAIACGVNQGPVFVGGGEEQIWSKNHYYRLPEARLQRRLKILLKSGTTATLIDTGER